MKKLIFIVLSYTGIVCHGQIPMTFPFDNKSESVYEDNPVKALSISPEILQKVVSINNGNCSGAIISEKGLVLTNYHCFFEFIYTLDTGLVRNGFYADKRKKEIPLEGTELEITLNATEITAELQSMEGGLNTEERIDLYLKNLEPKEKTRYVIKKFEPEERFFLIAYKIYDDIRLVCLPPENAANFGGQSANWSWPRYATDFCILRIADEGSDTLPFFETHLEFSSDEKVYSLGYPADTKRSQSSFAMNYKINFENKIRNLIRNKRVQILSEELSFRPQLQNGYYSSLQDISNYNLFIKGETELFNKYGYISQARKNENAWKYDNPDFVSVMDSLNLYYKQLQVYSAFRLFLNEALVAPEIFLFAFKFNSLNELLKAESKKEQIEQTVVKLQSLTENHFRTYDPELDRKVFYEMLELYDNYLPDSLKPEFFFEIERKYEGDFYNYTKDLFNNSVFSSSEKTLKFLESPDLDLLQADPAFIHTTAFVEHYFTSIAPHVNSISAKLNGFNQAYSENAKKKITEANGTIRLSSGMIKGYQPSEAISYSETTTFQGWAEQNLTGEYRRLPKKFLELLEQNRNRKLCFLANLDVSSGNSGSPVINEDGRLIGIVFDQNPEGMANQFVYDPDIQRATCLSFQAVWTVVEQYFESSSLMKEIQPQAIQKD